MRRIILCCDGTWESAFFQTRPDMLTNVSRIANALEVRDERGGGCEQVTLYIAGLGTGQETLEGAITGAFGASLLDQVREGYHFIAQNWRQGDEILLFGFSRGAYVCRLLLTLVDEIGVLDPKMNLHLFPALFNTLCLPVLSDDVEAAANRRRRGQLLAQIQPFIAAQKAAQPDGFLVKVFGCFECVPLLHFPLVHAASHAGHTPFSTLDALLEPSVQHVFQALALNERRAPYKAIIFTQDPHYAPREQTLTQVWFTGSHGDVGGGYDPHDLSDLPLHWLASQLSPFLALDYNYLASVSADPSAPWGEAAQHPGFHITPGHSRVVPLPLEPGVHPADFSGTQFIHPSILRQPRDALPRRLRRALDEAEHAGEVLGVGGVWGELGPWEREIKRRWRRAFEQRSLSGRGGPRSWGPVEREMDLWRQRCEQVYNAGDAPSLSRAR